MPRQRKTPPVPAPKPAAGGPTQTYRYELSDRPTAESEANHWCQTFVYDQRGRLSTIDDPAEPPQPPAGPKRRRPRR